MSSIANLATVMDHWVNCESFRVSLLNYLIDCIMCEEGRISWPWEKASFDNETGGKPQSYYL